MQRPESARLARAYAAYAKRLDGRVIVRRFDPCSDSYDTLTALLHRAFAPLGALGFNCPCVDQPAAATRERVLTGECFVALGNAHLVATMTMRSHDPDSRCDPYRSRRVATLEQLAVDPVWQDRGIGRALLAFAQRRAAARGATHLALDAPYAAARLIAFYRRDGFQPVDVVRFPGHNYDSTILCKAVGGADGSTRAHGTIQIDVARQAGAAS
ncbi:TPA: GNAT family N-acetyltransferase [Burkholderia cenocepacia]|uniref:GNAT family N-acetyltransferase n=1 Tax=Burkholderia cenocepacia TaxID=95486 RepID=UPI0019072A0A|nr:GNAT family N-acetyltransferase [Burkholderia cenocepacia]MBJ9919976.1 GNAT family N-acetyltransferase [Burkholderia cenocepacia]MCW3604926.1 GNAT family N-acetyltransferase [Burkholderia cenocepacia]MCW5186889.1 GNAT family N-acetyltransferase [Burkholderia cenocepacia]MEB2601582.1 GNAT family N-acetyltransferase [Burkholderia cenocepacia]